jgi:hypothetical protein
MALGENDPRGRRSAQADVRADDLRAPLEFDTSGRISIRVAPNGGLELTSEGVTILTGSSLQVLDDGAIELNAESVAGPGLLGQDTEIRISPGIAVSDGVENTEGTPTVGGLQTSLNDLVTQFNLLLVSLRDAKHLEAT